jgi:urease accessory protein
MHTDEGTAPRGTAANTLAPQATTTGLDPSVPVLLRLLQLSSSLLPIGAFAYSQGLEAAVERGWVTTEAELASWLSGVGACSVASLDLPLHGQALAAWSRADTEGAMGVSERLLSYRESAELRDQEQRLGAALGRVLGTLGVPQAAAFEHDERASYVAGHALACAHFGIDAHAAATAYAYVWLEQQVSAAARLVPLGHSAAQRALSRLLGEVPSWLSQASQRDDEHLGTVTPGLAMAAAWHETQYTRLFRS